MNPIIVNSPNIIQFGFSVTFSLKDNKIIFNSNTLTQYISGNAANVQGIYFQVFDASGLEVKAFNFSSRDINPAAPAPYILTLANGFAQYGQFIINGIIVDQDGKQYKVNLKKYVNQPECFKNGNVKGEFIADVNCDVPSITISEVTNLSYNGKVPVSKTKAGLFYYPQGTSAAINFTFTPFKVDTVYSGPYRVKNTTTAVYDLEDNVFVSVDYVTEFDFDVTCNSKLVDLLCCIDSVQSTYLKDPNSARGRDAKSKLLEIEVPFLVATIKEKAGKDNSEEIRIISEKLQCDCTGTQIIEPRLIAPGSGSGNNFTFTGNCGTEVSSVQSGDTTQVTIKSKTVTVVKDESELGFSIVKDSNTCNDQYKIVVNYEVLAGNILTTIDEDNDLAELIKNIVGATGTDISLAGLDGGCIITLGNCKYQLIESNAIIKTVNSIVINGTTYNAPSALLLNNTTSVQSWLNGLSLGTFAVSLDTGSNNIVIVSNSNPANITQLNLTIAGAATIRQFTKTCATLVDVLNAIIDYVCDIDSSKIKYGVALTNICSFDNTGAVVTTPVSAGTTLNVLLTSILSAQCVLFNKINSIALNCANVKTLFSESDDDVKSDDVLFGTKGGDCASITYAEQATVILEVIANNPTLKAALCILVASCTAPSCDPPTSVSGVLSSGPTCVPVTGISGSIS